MLRTVRSRTFTFVADLWEHDGAGAWHFVSLPEADADAIDAEVDPKAPGFGSVPVSVRIGDTRWETSIFPDRKRATYVLPVKKAVRAAEGLQAGATVEVELTVR
jgi:hypothetical protein